MTVEMLIFVIFVLSVFLGFELISKVPSMLHTPLMSGTNAIHGIILLGGMLVLASAEGFTQHVAGFVAVVLGSANVFGGFMVTDRMLQMFKRKKGDNRNEVEIDEVKRPHDHLLCLSDRFCSVHPRHQTAGLTQDRAAWKSHRGPGHGARPAGGVAAAAWLAW